MWCIASVSVLGKFIVWINEFYKNKFDIGEFDDSGRFDVDGSFYVSGRFCFGSFLDTFGELGSASVPC